MYFKDFPNFLYDFKYGDTLKTAIVTDITRNIRVRKEILANITLYEEYDIEDGETPELIAEKIYGDAKYHWVVMLCNDSIDYLTDFPLEESRLLKVIQEKYDNIYGIHHYENSDGYVVNSDEVNAYPVSNDEYERKINESKRRIKIVSPRLLNTVLKNFKDLL